MKLIGKRKERVLFEDMFFSLSLLVFFFLTILVGFFYFPAPFCVVVVFFCLFRRQCVCSCVSWCQFFVFSVYFSFGFVLSKCIL